MRVCDVNGCDRKHKAKGMCNPHYQRWTKYGRLNIVRIQKVEVGHKTIDVAGYVSIKVGHDYPGHRNGWIREHRLIMAEKLGRTVRSYEAVHHINGDKQDNKPENLELWISNHPNGERAEDLVRWAREILNKYE